jgi:T5SS/PEP-CTERM-associated repeat protein
VNWLPGAGAPPDSGDGAGFGLNATYTVEFFSDFAVSDALVSAGNVTWDLGQGVEFQRLYTVDAVEVTSGSQLRFFDGTLTANTMLISGGADVLVLGADKNGAAHITVTGPGSTLTHDNFLEVANYRPVTLTIQDGGSVTSGSGSVGADPHFDSEGIVNVFGAGSTWSTGVNIGSFQVHYGVGSTFNPNQIVINNFVANPLPGDFSDDGVVDAADYIMWRKLDLGPAAYNTWRHYFGHTVPGELGSGADVAVPEPGAIMLITVGLLGLYSHRSQRRRSPISF